MLRSHPPKETLMPNYQMNPKTTAELRKLEVEMILG